MYKIIAVGLIAIGLAGCQTPSQNIVVENSSNVNIVANNTAANPGYAYAAPAYAQQPIYVGPPRYYGPRCIWTQANGPYYQSRVCY